jgi:hypothetical protein
MLCHRHADTRHFPFQTRNGLLQYFWLGSEQEDRYTILCGNCHQLFPHVHARYAIPDQAFSAHRPDDTGTVSKPNGGGVKQCSKSLIPPGAHHLFRIYRNGVPGQNGTHSMDYRLRELARRSECLYANATDGDLRNVG